MIVPLPEGFEQWLNRCDPADLDCIHYFAETLADLKRRFPVLKKSLEGRHVRDFMA